MYMSNTYMFRYNKTLIKTGRRVDDPFCKCLFKEIYTTLYLIGSTTYRVEMIDDSINYRNISMCVLSVSTSSSYSISSRNRYYLLICVCF